MLLSSISSSHRWPADNPDQTEFRRIILLLVACGVLPGQLLLDAVGVVEGVVELLGMLGTTEVVVVGVVVGVAFGL